MAIRTKDIKKTATIAQIAYHTPILVPPDVAALYGAAAAAASMVAGFAFTVAGRAWGGASSVAIVATTATGFTGGMTLSVLVTGRDENHDVYSETITITGNAAATQSASSNGLFSSVDSMVVVAVSGGTAGSGATFQIGTGAGTAGSLIKIPNPYRGVPATSLVGYFSGAGIAAPMTLTSSAPHNVLTYASQVTVNQVRMGIMGIFGQDPRSFMEL